MSIERGSLWWATFPEPSGSGPGYDRPVVVIQSDAINISTINTVIVIAITRNLRLANAPGNVLLNARDSGLPEDSVVNVSQVLTIDKGFLNEYIGDLPTRLMHEVDQGLKIVLDLLP